MHLWAGLWKGELEAMDCIFGWVFFVFLIYVDLGNMYFFSGYINENTSLSFQHIANSPLLNLLHEGQAEGIQGNALVFL